MPNKRVEKARRILDAFKAFFESDSIREASLKCGISKSAIQRYIYDPLALELLGQEIIDYAHKKLVDNRIAGNHKGGINFMRLYEKTRNELGEFNGCKKK